MLQTGRLALATRTGWCGRGPWPGSGDDRRQGAGGHDWGTMTEVESAKLEACKMSADSGDAWKV